MTKETKVGLLIGMGVILLVGIILTDHLSEARQQQPPKMTDFAGEAQESLTPPPPVIEVHGVVQSQPPPVPPAATEALAPPATPAAKPAEPNEPSFVNRAAGVPATLQDSHRDRRTAAFVRSPGRRSAPLTASRIHVVSSGESLWTIAERAYGNGRYWKRIKETNPASVANDNTVQVGARLQIPARIGPASDSSPQTATARSAETSDQKGWRTVTITTGETLSSLARRFLGDAKRWQVIYDANRDYLTDPDQLTVGLRLRVPTRG